jgi:hypothetical protein
VKLHELEIGESGTGAIRRSHPLTERARRIRRPLPERGGAAGCDESGARGDGPSVGDNAQATLVRMPERQHPLALGNSNPRMREYAFRKYTCDAITGRSAARMNDAPTAMAAFEAEPFVELDAELHEIANSRGSLSGENRHRTVPAESTTGANRVLSVKLGRVVAPNSGGDPALSKLAVRREKRPLREHENVSLSGGAESCDEPGDSASHDDEIEKLGVRCAVFRAHASFSL